MSLKKLVTDILTNENDKENSVSSSLILNKLSYIKKLEEENREERRKFLLKIHHLMTGKPNKNGHVQYFVAESKERAFIDRGDKIVFDKKNQEVDKISVGLELAIAKFGNNLKLSGSDEFKTKVALIAAEKGLNVIFKPEKYNQIYLEKFEQINSNFITAQETQQEQQTVPAEATQQDKTIQYIQTNDVLDKLKGNWNKESSSNSNDLSQEQIYDRLSNAIKKIAEENQKDVRYSSRGIGYFSDSTKSFAIPIKDDKTFSIEEKNTQLLNSLVDGVIKIQNVKSRGEELNDVTKMIVQAHLSEKYNIQAFETTKSESLKFYMQRNADSLDTNDLRKITEKVNNSINIIEKAANSPLPMRQHEKQNQNNGMEL